MRVDVDKARRNDLALGVDFLTTTRRDMADGRDLSVAYGDVCLEGRSAGAVDDEPLSDNEIMHAGSSLLRAMMVKDAISRLRRGEGQDRPTFLTANLCWKR
jgi:hypothetical protein